MGMLLEMKHFLQKLEIFKVIEMTFLYLLIKYLCQSRKIYKNLKILKRVFFSYSVIGKSKCFISPKSYELADI